MPAIARAGLGWTRSWELHLYLPRGRRGPGTWTAICCLCRPWQGAVGTWTSALMGCCNHGWWLSLVYHGETPMCICWNQLVPTFCLLCAVWIILPLLESLMQLVIFCWHGKLISVFTVCSTDSWLELWDGQQRVYCWLYHLNEIVFDSLL